MNTQERFNLALRAHASEHAAMRERGMAQLGGASHAMQRMRSVASQNMTTIRAPMTRLGAVDPAQQRTYLFFGGIALLGIGAFAWSVARYGW